MRGGDVCVLVVICVPKRIFYRESGNFLPAMRVSRARYVLENYRGTPKLNYSEKN